MDTGVSDLVKRLRGAPTLDDCFLAADALEQMQRSLEVCTVAKNHAADEYLKKCGELEAVTRERDEARRYGEQMRLGRQEEVMPNAIRSDSAGTADERHDVVTGAAHPKNAESEVRRQAINDACAAIERVALGYESPDTPWLEHPVIRDIRNAVAALDERLGRAT